MQLRAHHYAALAAATTAWLAACAVPDYSDPRADGSAGADADSGSDTLLPDTDSPGPLLTCEGCHTSEDLLKAALATLEPPAPKIEGTGDG